MNNIGVAISGKKSNNIFLKTVAETLRKEPDLRICEVDMGRTLERLLRRWRPHILILEVSDGQSDVGYKQYFDQNPGLAIIGLDTETSAAIMRVHDLGRDMLLRLIHTLSSEQSDLTDRSSHSRLHLLTPSDVQKHSIEPTRITISEDTSGLLYQNTRQHMNDVLRWLDLCLNERLAQEESTDSGVSTPGWAMSASRARELLGSEYAQMNERDFRKAREELESIMAQREAASSKIGVSSKLLALFNAFELDSIDRRILILTLAPELDARYAHVFGFLNDDLTRRRPTATLLSQLIFQGDALGWDLRDRLANEGAFARYNLLLVDPSDPRPGSEVALLPAPEIVDFLLSRQECIPKYTPYIHVTEPNNVRPVDEQSTTGLREKLVRWREISERADNDAPILQLVGDEATRQWFEYAALNAGDTIVLFDLAALEEHDQRFLESYLTAARVAVLHNAILLVTGLSCVKGDRRDWLDTTLLAELYPRVSRLVVHSHTKWLQQTPGPVWLVERAKLGVAERATIWQDRARALGLSLTDADAHSMASTVQFQEPEIDATLKLVGRQDSSQSSLQAAARRVARSAVPGMVRRLEAAFSWDDIVLPDAVRAQIHQIPGHVRHAGKVFEDWGYETRMPYGQGIAALFSGMSGTGKTMTAQIIAGELGVDLFQVDLAKTVSKYIGETEKNLDTVFEAAEKASAVLLFDEADALFGKRTEVRDAHDRYANVEVAYLLQRMEAYAGLAILTTNFRQNLDSAFMRRLRFVVEFPAPEAGDREAIWERVFPPGAQLAEDVSFKFLARRLNLTGGHIQQIAIRAAFAAVVEGETIAMRHIVQATREELGKLGMLNAEKTLAEQLAA